MPVAKPGPLRAAEGGSGGSNEEIVRRLLTTTTSVDTKPPDLSDQFHMRCNGVDHDLAGFKRMWTARKKLLKSLEFEVLDLFGRADSVAAVRCAHLTAKDGSQQPSMTVVDVWRVQNGQVVAAEQCWQLMRGPAGDDIEITAQEGATAEAVRAALASLQCLPRVQHSLAELWSPDFRAHINGVEFDFQRYAAHWEALQAELSTLLIDVQQLVVSHTAVGAVYDMLCGRRGSREAAQLQVVAVFHVGPGGRIARCTAAVRLVSGAAGDEELATLMPAG